MFTSVSLQYINSDLSGSNGISHGINPLLSHHQFVQLLGLDKLILLVDKLCDILDFNYPLSTILLENL